MELYICSHCGNIVTKLEDKKVPISCCGEFMKKIEPNTFDGALEKHVPKFIVENNLVKVIESYSNGWSKIDYNGLKGYCMTEYLEEAR